ncbi:hypothetical protein HaLaN_14491, partial [Haematococcus lacustris]
MPHDDGDGSAIVLESLGQAYDHIPWLGLWEHRPRCLCPCLPALRKSRIPGGWPSSLTAGGLSGRWTRLQAPAPAPAPTEMTILPCIPS